MYTSLLENNKESFQKFISDQKAFSRNRKLGLKDTIGMLMSMALTQNNFGYDISLQSYYAEVKNQLPTEAPGRSAFCQARQKLPWEVMAHLLTCVNQDAKFKAQKKHQWHGHTVRAIDGTWLTLPHSKDIIKNFPQVTKNNEHLVHYPTATLLTSINVLTGQVFKASIGNYWSSEVNLFDEMMESFAPGDVSLLDRIYYSKELVEKMNRYQQFFIMRVRSNMSLYKRLLFSDRREITVEVNGHKLRVIRSDMLDAEKAEPIVIVTNLLEEDQAEIIQLYFKRWKVETVYLRMKSILKIEKFRSRTTKGIYQEIFAHLLVLSMVALSVLSAEEAKALPSQSVPNFKSAIEVMRRNLSHYIYPSENIRSLRKQTKQMNEEILKVRCKPQPGRHYPRVSLQPQNPWTQNRGAKKEAFKKLQNMLTEQH